MSDRIQYIVGTSGYSFPDWVGEFYPDGTRPEGMLEEYAKHFEAVEVNFTYYRMPTARTMDSLARRTPAGFAFWVKANESVTHKGDVSQTPAFLEALAPMAEAGKLAGVLLQFPQSFHRTIDNRKYLAGALEAFASTPTAVEFRHRSWQDPATARGLADRGVTIAVPDSPALPDLYHIPPTATTRTGYLRLHSRSAEKWHAGMAQRYDYDYSAAELAEFAVQWGALAGQVDKVFAFFNNCHRGQAARNAEAFRKIVGTL
ncbi:MAG: DUF72 domain-containing protein [Planctomycetota bacterium]|nr:DUF72 domain-containing protein [Planctomycetota bacterium]